jgi:upstream activation factor subunit UAF30
MGVKNYFSKLAEVKKTLYLGRTEHPLKTLNPNKMATKKAKKKPAKKAAKKKSARKPSAAFMKALTPSPALAAVVGTKALPRTEVVKKMWAYIKKNKLQDSKNKRMINADAKLKPIFGGKSQVSMFDMAKHLAKNLK